MRINQYLAHASGLSRRQADAVVAAGRVLVNRQPAKVGSKVAAGDQVELDGQAVATPKYQTILLHKPVGYVTSRRPQGSTPTIYDLLPAHLHSLKPGGRLDRDSSGLLVLTNDGELAQRLQHPARGKLKHYLTELDQPLKQPDLDRLQKGVRLDDGISRLGIRRRGSQLEVSLGEGRNRQIRRSFAALGYTVTRLHRTNIGDINLGDLPSGKWLAYQPTSEQKR